MDRQPGTDSRGGSSAAGAGFSLVLVGHDACLGGLRRAAVYLGPWAMTGLKALALIPVGFTTTAAGFRWRAKRRP